MKFVLALSVFSLLQLVSSAAPVSVEDLEGVWRGSIDLPFLLVLNEYGVASACRSDLTKECLDELPPGIEEIIIQNNTFSLNFTQFVGVNTMEKAAELFPACARSGVYPFETITPLPPAGIAHYDHYKGGLYFVDDRRPDDVNCVFVRLQKYGKVPEIKLEYIITSEGPLDEVVRLGPSFRCQRPVGLCIAEQTPEKIYNKMYVRFRVPCAEGACLKIVDKTLNLSQVAYIV